MRFISGFLALFLCMCNATAFAQAESAVTRLALQWDRLNDIQKLDSSIAIPYSDMVNDLNGSKTFLSQSFTIAQQNKDLSKQGEIADKLSKVHYLLGAYDSASYYNLQAQQVFQQTGQTAELGNVLCGYGYAMKRRNMSDAFVFMRRGINLLEKERDTYRLCGAYDNFGVLHEMSNDLDSATYYYQKGLNLKESLSDSVGIPYSLNNLGGIAAMKGNFEEALIYIEKGRKIRETLGDTMGLAESFNLLGDLYKSWKRWEAAVDAYSTSIFYCDQLNYPHLKQFNLEHLSFCYQQMGDFQNALIALKSSGVIRDSILNEKSIRQINDLELRFKSAEKDKAIAQLEERSARRRQYIIGISALLLLVMAGALLWIQRQRRRAESERNQAIIQERERGLEAVFTATEEERRRIAKDLHDGISQQLSGLRLSFESLSIDIQNVAPEKSQRLQKLNEVLDETCKEVRSISHQMMPRVLSESGLIPAIDDMLSKGIGLTSIQYRFEHFKVEGRRFPEKVELGLFRVCQELINNIMKHSGASEVVVQLFVSKGVLIMIVEDNGSGFSSASKRDGIGLTNISSRINTVDGEVTWEPGPQQGTVATVRVPVGE